MGKRNIAQEIPVWDKQLCIECSKCVLRVPPCRDPSEGVRFGRLKAFEDKLAKLGHTAQTGRHKKSHYKAPAPDAAPAAKSKSKS